MKRSREEGFSFIELLLALTIVSLLFAMVQPAAHRTRDKTKSVVCASNQKQLYQATLQYANDWNEYLPTSIAMLEPYEEETCLVRCRQEHRVRIMHAGEGGGKKGEEKKGGAPTPEEVEDATDAARQTGVLSPYYNFMREITRCPLIMGYMTDDPPVYSYGVNVLTAGKNLRDFYRDTTGMEMPAFSRMPLYADSDYAAVSTTSEMAFRHDRGERSKTSPVEGRCIVAFLDGHLGWVFENDAQALEAFYGGGGGGEEEEPEGTATPTPTPTETPQTGW